ncbi:MAG: sigma 54-interacting transcriptional regulator [Tissierellaceae bacterium]|nr:sigma 54-interacting transcriptional regulator [Tissierellaceae bacterium]
MKIAFIAPYEELTNLVLDISREMNIEVDAYTGSFEDAAEIAKRLEAKGYDILISRGATYQHIKDSVKIPIVKCEMTSFDILYAIFDSIKYLRDERKIGLILSNKLSLEAEKISEIFNIKLIYMASYNQIEETKEMVKEAIEKGAEVIIGGISTVRHAEDLGKKGVLLKTSKETVQQSIYTALEVYDLTRKQMMETERLNHILKFSYEGIIVTDTNGIVTFFNPTAERIFDINANKIIGKRADEYIPTTKLLEVVETGQAQLSQIQKFNNNTIITNRIPIKVKGKIGGAVATFQEISKIQDYEKMYRSEIYKKGLIAYYTFYDYIGENKAVKDMIKNAKIYAKSDASVLIIGESGTGKEILAQSIHNASNRCNNPFVAVNCSAIPENLLESELFGYEDGAFTGAKKGGKMGLFELAHTGTILLDEIGSMPLNLQSRLLRVLQEKEVWRLGSDKSIKVDVRVISSTNTDLFEAVEKGEFRRDLYFRLNVLKLETSPLRNRKNDVKLIFDYFVSKYSDKHITLSQQQLAILEEYEWPGNVRELQNFVERVSLLKEYVPMEKIIDDLIEGHEKGSKYLADGDSIIIKKGTKDSMEKQIFEKLYAECNYNATLLAEKLGISRTTVWKKLNS